MSKFTPYVEPEQVQGDTYKPIDHVGSTLIVKVKEHREKQVTPNSPDGGPAVIVDLIDLDGKEQTVYHDVLWMGGAMVDGLRKYVGRLVVIKVDERLSQSKRRYPAPISVDAAQIARADKWLTDNGDPFAPELGTVAKGDDSKPPF